MRGESRRPTVRRIVIAALLLLAIAEPVVMYHSLVREREHRQQAFAQMQQSATESAATDDAGR
jgi:hypothetical protein